MSVTITEKAAKEIQRVLSEQKMPEKTVAVSAQTASSAAILRSAACSPSQRRSPTASPSSASPSFGSPVCCIKPSSIAS